MLIAYCARKMVIKRFSCFISIVPQSLSLAASRHRTTWSLVRCSIVQRRAHCATYWCLPFVFLSWIHTSTLFRLSCLVKTKFFLALFSSVFLRLLFEFALFSLCIVLTCCGRRRASWYILQHAICHGLHLTPLQALESPTPTQHSLFMLNTQFPLAWRCACTALAPNHHCFFFHCF